MQTTSDHPAVRLVNVSKQFRLREGTTLKEFIPALLTRRKSSLPFFALRDVSFQIGRGETLGIIGRNGSGKSTILKLIAGITAPSQGEIFVNGKVSCLIELGAGFHPDLTGRENAYLYGAILGMNRARIASQMREMIGFAELAEFIDTPVKRYSSGMYLRLAFSVAIHSDPEILLVDESLAVGDAAFREKCFDRIEQLQERGGTIVLVSHDMGIIGRFCHRALLLNGGAVQAYGSPDVVVREYAQSPDTSGALIPAAPI